MGGLTGPVPTESAEQIALFRWRNVQMGAYPELELLHHIPNGGKRGKAEAGRFKAEGVKAGVPDVSLPVARGGYHGLYVEMKRMKGGRVSEEQARCMELLRAEGYCAVVCRGWDAAAAVILGYLKGEVVLDEICNY